MRPSFFFDLQAASVDLAVDSATVNRLDSCAGKTDCLPVADDFADVGTIKEDPELSVDVPGRQHLLPADFDRAIRDMLLLSIHFTNIEMAGNGQVVASFA